MFKEKGYYYCINGCFSYPIKTDGIKEFIQKSFGINRIEQIVYYDIHPDKFSYQRAMNEEYEVKKGSIFSLETTLLSLDFYYHDLSCQLQIAFFDDFYYGISLVYNAEKGTNLDLNKLFYSTLKPIYGNDGCEKSIVSLKDITSDDNSLFDNNFYISRELCEKMNIWFSAEKGKTILISENGAYYLKQRKRKQNLLFRIFWDAIKSKTDMHSLP